METTLHAEIADTAGRPKMVFGNGSTVLDDGLKDQNAEVILLHTTLSGFRRRASRLRDEIEGLRRRIESLSVSEISGFLEELGEDLAEFEE
jgi:hypothetical protein